jgi:N-acetylglutamate synthase-like GNAT family acetyltransferase
MKASPSIATAAACRPGTPFAMIANMAVCPELRRRGVSHMLMQVRHRIASWVCNCFVNCGFATVL